jgi:hypothetical protein
MRPPPFQHGDPAAYGVLPAPRDRPEPLAEGWLPLTMGSVEDGSAVVNNEDLVLPELRIEDHAGGITVEPPNRIRMSWGLRDLREVDIILPNGIITSASDGTIYDASTWFARATTSPYLRHDSGTQWKWHIRADCQPEERIDRTTLWLYSRTAFQYYHFWGDVGWRPWVAEHCGVPLGRGDDFDSAFVGTFAPGSVQQEFFNAIGLRPERLCHLPHGVYRFERVLLPWSISRPEVPLHPARNALDPRHHKLFSPNLVSWYRRIMRAVGRSDGPHRVYVRRGQNIRRNFDRATDDELASRLGRMGFTSVDPGRLDLNGQIRAFASARFVVGIHGAALTNLLWCEPGCRILEIMPERYEDASYRIIAAMGGHAFHRLVVPETGSVLQANVSHICEVVASMLTA